MNGCKGTYRLARMESRKQKMSYENESMVVDLQIISEHFDTKELKNRKKQKSIEKFIEKLVATNIYLCAFSLRHKK